MVSEFLLMGWARDDLAFHQPRPPGHPDMPPMDQWINARAKRHGLWVIPRPDETECSRTKLHLGPEGF